MAGEWASAQALAGRERLPPRRSLSSIYDFRRGRSMAAVTKRKRRLQRYTSAEFKPYVVALGQLALAWNDLQESLAALFWTLANPPPQPGDRVNYIPLRIWASIKSDRIQREILRTVINHSQTNWGRDRMTKDLIWLVDKAIRWRILEMTQSTLHYFRWTSLCMKRDQKKSRPRGGSSIREPQNYQSAQIC
jgi:hypothetical protein